MRKIVKGSSGCRTNTGERQVDFDPMEDLNEDNEISCIICGEILWGPGMDHALLDDIIYRMMGKN